MAWPSFYGLDTSRFDRNTVQRSPRPTIILVHDAWHTATHLEALARELRNLGYRVLVPQLPSSTSSHQPHSFEADVRTVFEHARPDIDAGLNVIMVMHGYSALPGSVAATRLNQHSLNRPRAGEVAQLIYFAGIIVDNRDCCDDVFRPAWAVEERGMLRIRSPGPIFYQDCALETARSAAALVQTQSANSFHAAVVNPGWRYIPSRYIVCELDRAISPSLQRDCVRTLQASNRDTTAVAMQAGHSPFLSRLRETVALIVESRSRSSSA